MLRAIYIFRQQSNRCYILTLSMCFMLFSCITTNNETTKNISNELTEEQKIFRNINYKSW